MSDGYLGLYRVFFNSPEWNEKRKLSIAEAWLDLFQSAAFAPTERLVKGKLIHLKIGELIASERFLEKRWSWSRTKVRNFIEMYEKNHRLNHRKDQGETVRCICNYATYVFSSTTEDTKENTTYQTTEEPPENHRRTKDKKDKKDKNSKKKNIMSSNELDDAQLVLAYLNEKSGSNYRLETKAHLTPIRARLKEKGVTVEGVCAMIDSKCAEWSGSNMAMYLRPQTLFAEKNFAAYYDQRNISFNDTREISDHAAGW